MKGMGVVDRLRRVAGEDKKSTDNGDRSSELMSLRRRIESLMNGRRREKYGPAQKYPPLHELVEGEEIATEDGSFFLAIRRQKSRQFHGRRPVGDLARLDMQAAALLADDPDIAGCRISQALFLDAETTGLSGGTGTLAFMIGLGSFENEDFVTRQIFIRDFSEERAALRYLKDVAHDGKFLVTFNGKAFDLNLLAARYILNRFASPLESLPHLDLLFPARRLFGHRLENSRLATLEKELLGFTRKDDIPGSEIPARYFSWLRRRDPETVAGIFRHNYLDVLSLALLAVHSSELMNSCLDARRACDPRDLLAAARLLEDRGEQARAADILLDLAACNRLSVRSEAQKMLSLIFKRRRDWEKAVPLWGMMLREDPEDLFAVVELAKWHEHGCRNYAEARRVVGRALQGSTLLDGDIRAALEHRLQRLQSRLTGKYHME